MSAMKKLSVMKDASFIIEENGDLTTLLLI
jgi:hypothetical protein